MINKKISSARPILASPPRISPEIARLLPLGSEVNPIAPKHRVNKARTNMRATINSMDNGFPRMNGIAISERNANAPKTTDSRDTILSSIGSC